MPLASDINKELESGVFIDNKDSKIKLAAEIKQS